MNILKVILSVAGASATVIICAFVHEFGEWCKDCCPYWTDENEENEHERLYQ